MALRADPARPPRTRPASVSVTTELPGVLFARPVLLPLAFTVGLAAFAVLPRIHDNPRLLGSFVAAVVGLLVWLCVLTVRTRAAGRSLRVEVSLRPQHYLQAIAHLSIFVYWGIYWQPLRDAAALIAAQIVFAYAFDMLLAWSRRDEYTLGFGPFPIIFSTNLFLRFRDDWFYLQFLMVAVGFLAKELIRWQKDGRHVHIFNPSSFALALFSLGLIVTGTTRITWGEDIASLLILPPQIYLFIFVVSLPGQFLFRVTSMTLPAVLTTYACSQIYLKLTGTYFFFDSDIPIAVFLGMHLLFTDPSTSPRTELGRVVFGIMYGLSVVGLYALLGALGAPTFYDKLLQVPTMNLMVRAIDRFARSRALERINPERIGGAALTPRMRSLAYVTVWIVVFGAMTAAKGVGDHHPGFTIPFWEQACREGRPDACTKLAIRESGSCRGSSGWACNELGILAAADKIKAAPPDEFFRMACSAGFGSGCDNRRILSAGARDFRHGDPALTDYIQLLSEGKGPLRKGTPSEIYDRACDEGWTAACGSLAGLYFVGAGVPLDRPRGIGLLQKACDGGHSLSCLNLGVMFKRGDGVARDDAKALDYARKACNLGLVRACRLVEQGG